MASLPTVGRVTKASRMPKRAKGVVQKIASLARQTSKAYEKRPCGVRGCRDSPFLFMAFLVGVVMLEVDVSTAADTTRSLFISFARGDLLGIVETAGGMNTPLALFGVREAFVRLAITFSPSDSIVALSISVFRTLR